LLDSSLAPQGKHIVHAFTPSSMSEWEGLSRKEYLQKKEKYFSFLVEKISTILPNLEQNIDHKEIGTPKTHKKFLGRYEGSYGPIPSKKLLGLLPMPFNTTKIQNFYFSTLQTWPITPKINSSPFGFCQSAKSLKLLLTSSIETSTSLNDLSKQFISIV